ncbi:hypothetical protein GCM10020000_49420 [Streptomyces olivoverticillatus]
MFDPTIPPAFPRHVVTAVLVAHDGARWLPDALSGLLGQERPVQQAVAADTGSADHSAQLLADALGDDKVLHLARRAGFGTAVDEAVRTAARLTAEELPYLKSSSGWDPVGRTWRENGQDPSDPSGAYDSYDSRRTDLEPVQWLWLLHDDCAPDPAALHELLRVADSDPPRRRRRPQAAQLVRPQAAAGGRRLHRPQRPPLDRPGAPRAGPGPARPGAPRPVRLHRGHARAPRRVGRARRLRPPPAPDARRRRPVLARPRRRTPRPRRPPTPSCGTPRHPPASAAPSTAWAADRPTRTASTRPAPSTPCSPTAGAPLLPYVMLRVVLGTLLRTLGYLVGKAPGQALDELAGFAGILLRPGRILAARKRRGRPKTPPGELRPLFPPPGATLRATVEQLASDFGARADDGQSSAGRHGAVESGPGGDDADYLEIEQFTRLKRIARRPAPVLFALLLLVSAVACRGLFGGGSLSGGALLPVPDHLSGLWSAYTAAWHPVGTGSTAGGPPYAAVLAALTTLCLGSTGFTLTLLLVCSVPLAGLTAYFASRPPGLLPAAARLGERRLRLPARRHRRPRHRTARHRRARRAAAAHGTRGRHRRHGFRDPAARPGWRACWTYALLLTVTTAFTPRGVAAGAAAGTGRAGAARPQHRREPGRVRPTPACGHGHPLVVLAPWSLGLFTDPARFLTEAGLDYGHGTASALQLLAADPGGPKTLGWLLLLGVVLAALAALLRPDRQSAIRTAWAVALTGLLCAALWGGTSQR